MHIQYYLADGTEIEYETEDQYISLSDINNLAMLYAQKRPNDLPDAVFINVQLLQDFVRTFGVKPQIVPADSGPQIVSIMTAVGPLRIVPKPWACDDCLLLVGKDEDFDRYDMDKVFEEVVLKDCERDDECEHDWRGATGEGWICIKCNKGHIGS